MNQKLSYANSRIVEFILKQIEAKNVLPWQCGYSSGLPRNYVSGRKYSGRNILTCLMSGYSNPNYMTFVQAKQLGGIVRKGEHGIPIYFAKGHYVEKDEETGEEKFHSGTAKVYFVFNVAQIDGIDEQMVETGTNPDIESFLCRIPVAYDRGKSSGWVLGTNTICIPMRSEFANDEEYYSDLLHELVHWTGMELGRDQSTWSKDHDKYSYEELVAEIGACFLRNHFGINQGQVVDNSVAYISGWLKHLQDNPEWIIKASADAQRAFDRLILFCDESCVSAVGGLVEHIEISI